MDPPPPRKPSGIPRPQSKLPVLRRQPSQTLAAQQPVVEAPKPTRTHAATVATTAPRLQKRQSLASLSRPAAQLPPKSTTAPSRRPISGVTNSSTAKNATRPGISNGSRSVSRGSQSTSRPTTASVKSHDERESGDQLGSLNGFRSASRQDFSDDHYSEDRSPVESEDPSRERKGSRPSLSDRAIESLQKVPTTPKDRRRSSFFAPTESPMGPPHRPPSSSSRASSQTRPGTSDGPQPLSRPTTPGNRTSVSARPATRTSLGGFGFTPKSTDKRRVSGNLTARLQSSREPVPASPNAPPVPKSTTVSSLTNGKLAARPQSKTVGARPAKPRPGLARVFGSDADSTPSASAAPPTPSTAKRIVSNSSAALREQIAAAKAAARKEKAKHDSGLSSNAATDSAFESDFHNDPFNQAPKDEKHVLRNRVRTALTDGKLNISAIGLKELPEEVLKMYDPAEMERTKVNWAEVVDVTRFIAADNELSDLSEDVFPDKSAEEITQDDDAPSYPFMGLEYIDLHGNHFQAIPPGLRRLERLTSLNLTHNKLENSAFDIITQIRSLKELKLGNNGLSGHLPGNIAQLTRLEKLELQENRLLGLPEAIRELVSLKVFNVAGNQLTALPMEAMAKLPLIELDASKNALIGSVFPLGGISSHPTLQTLNVANNSLAALTFSETLDMPKIQTLNVSNNQLRNLPPMTDWIHLITLAASDNKLTEFPPGFSDLQKLRNVNLTSNDIRIVDSDICRMSGLESLILAANPLREKKYLTMSVDQIQTDLRAKMEPEEAEEPADDDFINGHGEPAAASKFLIKPNGVLDLASKSLTDEVDEDLHNLLQTLEVPTKEILLQSNRLTIMPPSLALATNLRILNLSNNPFTTDYLTEPLSLPVLRELTLNTCRLTTLEPLMTSLSAPDLRILDLTANRLTGALPALRAIYPNLTTLWAKDNQFTSITALALQGFHTVNLASNALAHLPPDIGLLWDEGLRFLEVGSNAFRVPNYRVLEKGTEATLRWLMDRMPVDARLGSAGGDTGKETEDEEWFDAHPS